MDSMAAASPNTRSQRTQRLASAFLLALALSGCATQGAYLSAGQAHLGVQPYEVGPITVVIRPQPEVEMICRLRGAKVPTASRIQGCYVPADKMIVSTADPYVLLHEFKHHFEGSWHK